MEKEVKEIKKYIFWGVIAGTIILSYLMLKGLLISIITAILLAYLVKPMHDKLSKKLNKSLSAFITILTVLIIILSILAITINSLIKQLYNLLGTESIAFVFDYISKVIDLSIIQNNLPTITSKIADAIINLIPTTISYIPEFLLNIFIIFLTAYYVLIEWDNLERRVANIIPFANKEEIITKIKKRTKYIINGTLLIAFLEAVFSIIVLWALGIKPYLVLGVLIGILAFIPAIGPGLIWIPLAILELIYGKILVMAGVIILGLILSIYFDSLLRIKLIGKRTETHPVIILFGIIGGIQIFGVIGLILGPVILSILVLIIENLPKEKPV